MTNPCSLGFKCPYSAMSEDCLPICTYPKLPPEITEDDMFGIADECDCELMPYPSAIFDLMVVYDDEDVQNAVNSALKGIEKVVESFRAEIKRRCSE